MKYEKTLLLLKPGVIERGIVGDILQRFERKGLDVLGLKVCKPTKSQYVQHYKEHQDQSFYKDLMDYMQSDFVVAMVIGGLGAVEICRKLCGATNPQIALPGTIRGDFGITMPANIIHSSDSTHSASREIKIFFSTSEIRKPKENS